MRAYRSSILGALLALTCIPGLDAVHRTEERVRETLMSAILMWAPDLAPEATLELLLEDVKALALQGPSYEQAAERIAGTLREWANAGRSPLSVQDRATGAAGTWHTRVRFLAPGSYSAEVYRIERRATVEGNGEREVDAWMSASLATRAAASDAALDKALELQKAALDAARAGYRPHPTIPGRLADGTIVVYDDIVKPEDVTPERRAKMEAWFEETLARKSAADLAARHRDARDRLFSAYPAGDEARISSRRIYEPKLEPAPPPPVGPPRYSAKPKPARAPKHPHLRAQQRERRATKARKKARRGWL